MNIKNSDQFGRCFFILILAVAELRFAMVFIRFHLSDSSIKKI
jgi:hypothetical protein